MPFASDPLTLLVSAHVEIVDEPVRRGTAQTRNRKDSCPSVNLVRLGFGICVSSQKSSFQKRFDGDRRDIANAAALSVASESCFLCQALGAQHS